MQRKNNLQEESLRHTFKLYININIFYDAVASSNSLVVYPCP